MTKVFNPDKPMELAVGSYSGNKCNRYNIKKTTFREFAEGCAHAEPGGKHEWAYSRGIPNEVDGEYRRNDKDLKSANFVIMDCDHAVSSPKEIHEVLKKLNLVHFIYTTHSHTSDDNRLRVVVPCKMSEKSSCKPTTQALFALVNEAGAETQYTNESATWSQLWYFPTRENPNDGLFEFYQHMEGTSFSQEEGTFKAASAPEAFEEDENAAPQRNSLDELSAQIIAGDHFNNPMAYYFRAVENGEMSTAVAVSIVRTLVGQSLARNPDHPNHKKWRVLFEDDDIERQMEARAGDAAASEPAAELEIIHEPDLEEEHKYQKKVVDWPPGIMGDLSKSVSAYSNYPNKMVSIVTALGLVAGISGRRFNINGAGLNLYLTLLMNTGEGKDAIDSFITTAMRSSHQIIGDYGFSGSRRYTGPKPLMHELSKKRCMLSVFTEAGFMFKSKAGDQSGLTRCILDLYGKSGNMEVMKGESYSDDKNNIPAVVSPSFSMINESTPEVFHQSLKNGTETGELTRMNIFRVFPEDVEINRNKVFSLSYEVLEKLNHLMTRCMSTNTVDDPLQIDITPTEEMFEFATQCKKEQRACADEDPNRANMLSRSALKAWKVACLISVFNNFIDWPEHGTPGIKLSDEAWKWALSLHEFEMEGLEEFFKRAAESGLHDIVENNMYKPICRLLQPKGCKWGPYNDDKHSISTQMKDANRIPYSMLRNILRKCRPINDLTNVGFGRDGFDLILKYMEDCKYIKQTKGQFITVRQTFFDNF